MTFTFLILAVIILGSALAAALRPNLIPHVPTFS